MYYYRGLGRSDSSIPPTTITNANCLVASFLALSCFVDLRPYANTAAYTINETASIQRTYRLFRTLGLRHLCVCNHNNQVVGIITRKDLLPEALLESLIRVRRPSGVTEGGGGIIEATGVGHARL